MRPTRSATRWWNASRNSSAASVAWRPGGADHRNLNAIPPDATGDQAAQRDDIMQRRALVIRGFEDVQRTIRYACDVPVQLEARLGAYARALQAKL